MDVEISEHLELFMNSTIFFFDNYKEITSVQINNFDRKFMTQGNKIY